MNIRLGLTFKGKKIFFDAKRKNFFGKISGLMFSRKEHAKILLFNFSKEKIIRIHSFFVYYPFIAVWLDKDNKVLDLEIVKPFLPDVHSSKKAYSLVEIPLNQRNLEIVKKFFPVIDGNSKDLNISENKR